MWNWKLKYRLFNKAKRMVLLQRPSLQPLKISTCYGHSLLHHGNFHLLNEKTQRSPNWQHGKQLWLVNICVVRLLAGSPNFSH